MKKINLRELYPDIYTTDFFVDVTEEVMETIRAAERAEAAYERKMYRYKAQKSPAFSLKDNSVKYSSKTTTINKVQSLVLKTP